MFTILLSFLFNSFVKNQVWQAENLVVASKIVARFLNNVSYQLLSSYELTSPTYLYQLKFVTPPCASCQMMSFYQLSVI